ncbi:hypothetical protein HEP85_45140 [Streptomyces sp. RPA4-2]|uniref:hypothetical protein n=1 Tax=Streptomyces sp. RPA4-2 TaxID=2721244 RepID=UPI0034E85E31
MRCPEFAGRAGAAEPPAPGELVPPSGPFGLVAGRSGEVPSWWCRAVAANRVDGSAEAYRTTGVGCPTAGEGAGLPGAVRRCTTGLSLRPAGPGAATGRPPPTGACGGEIRAVER